jgi:hypothetical protein
MPTLLLAMTALLLSGNVAAQKTVSFPTADGGIVYADVYGEGHRGVVLAHGGEFNVVSSTRRAGRNKLEPWRRQDFKCWRSGSGSISQWPTIPELGVAAFPATAFSQLQRSRWEKRRMATTSAIARYKAA